MPTPAEDEETAKFHYAEGNKFGLEFAKSLFLFNSSLIVALIAYLAAKNVNAATLLWVEKAILWFWLAWVVSISVFALGYRVNLYQGNSHRARADGDKERADEAWFRAQCLSQVILRRRDRRHRAHVGGRLLPAQGRRRPLVSCCVPPRKISSWILVKLRVTSVWRAAKVQGRSPGVPVASWRSPTRRGGGRKSDGWVCRGGSPSSGHAPSQRDWHEFAAL
jgi:hypothetical protein